MEILALIGLLFLFFWVSKTFKKIGAWCQDKSVLLADLSSQLAKPTKKKSEKVHSRSLSKSLEEYKSGDDPYTVSIRSEINMLTDTPPKKDT